LGKKLVSAFGCPVHVLNDVDAGVFGEYTSGAGRDERCVVGVFPGTGIGGGCVYEGRLIRGGGFSCMEIGHIPVVPDGPLCGCGRRGCLETVASRLAIAGAAAAAAYRGEAPTLLGLAKSNVAKMRTGVLTKAIEGGDVVVEKIVRQAAQWLGRGVAVVVNLLAPDCVVLGGGLVEAMPELYREEVTASVAAHVMPSFEGTYRIAVAELGDDAIVVGAAAWAKTMQEA
jgi:glucokinase